MLSLQRTEDTQTSQTGKFNYCWSRSLPLEGHLGQLGPAIHKHLQSHIDHLTEHLQESQKKREPHQKSGTK